MTMKRFTWTILATSALGLALTNCSNRLDHGSVDMGGASLVRRVLYPELLRRIYGWTVRANGGQVVLGGFGTEDRLMEFDADGRALSGGIALPGAASGLDFKPLSDGTLGFSVLTISDGPEAGLTYGRYAYGSNIEPRQPSIAPWTSGSWLTDELWLAANGPLWSGIRDLGANDAVRWSIRREGQSTDVWSRDGSSILASGGPLLASTGNEVLAVFGYTPIVSAAAAATSPSSIRALRFRTSDGALLEEREILAPTGQHIELHSLRVRDGQASLVFNHGPFLKVFQFSVPTLASNNAFGEQGVAKVPTFHGTEPLDAHLVVADGDGYLVGGVVEAADGTERSALWRLDRVGAFDAAFGLRTLAAGRTTFRGIQPMDAEIYTLNEVLGTNPWSFHRIAR